MTFAPRLSRKRQVLLTAGCSTWVVTISVFFPVRIRSYQTDWRTVLLDSVAQLVTRMSSSSRALMPAYSLSKARRM